MIVRNSAGIHSELDYGATIDVLSGAKDNLSGELITSPWDLYSVETLRDQHDLRVGTAVPTDVMVFGKGEPDNPAATKVGGRPFWPADREWPTTADGSPCLFLAQFNFSDSIDLFDVELPELILVLVTDSEEDWQWSDDGLSFHWVPADSVPEDGIQVEATFPGDGPFYGVRHRTADYPKASNAAMELEVSQSYNLPILNGTKIAGRPHFIQSGNDTDATFQGQLGSIQAAPEVPYPWVNQLEALSLEFRGNGIYAAGNSAVFGDMGSIYLFMHADGTVERSFECY